MVVASSGLLYKQALSTRSTSSVARMKREDAQVRTPVSANFSIERLIANEASVRLNDVQSSNLGTEMSQWPRVHLLSLLNLIADEGSVFNGGSDGGLELAEGIKGVRKYARRLKLNQGERHLASLILLNSDSSNPNCSADIHKGIEQCLANLIDCVTGGRGYDAYKQRLCTVVLVLLTLYSMDMSMAKG